MNKVSGEQACELAVRAIEEQLAVLPLALAALLQAPRAPGGGKALSLARMGRSADSVPETGPAPFVLDPAGAASDTSAQHAVRVLVGNALLGVSMLLKEQGLSTSRTPQMQFLGHVRNAILHGNVFTIDAGHLPAAHFDGLVIDARLNGQLLFGDGRQAGFMEIGDAFALLQWLAHYLGAEPHQFTGGDAG